MKQKLNEDITVIRCISHTLTKANEAKTKMSVT